MEDSSFKWSAIDETFMTAWLGVAGSFALLFVVLDRQPVTDDAVATVERSESSVPDLWAVLVASMHCNGSDETQICMLVREAAKRAADEQTYQREATNRLARVAPISPRLARGVHGFLRRDPMDFCISLFAAGNRLFGQVVVNVVHGVPMLVLSTMANEEVAACIVQSLKGWSDGQRIFDFP